MAQVKIEGLRDTQVGEQSVYTGETHTVDEKDAKLLVRLKKARYVGKPPAEVEAATDEKAETATEPKTTKRSQAAEGED